VGDRSSRAFEIVTAPLAVVAAFTQDFALPMAKRAQKKRGRTISSLPVLDSTLLR
jgi:hypothetical protein